MSDRKLQSFLMSSSYRILTVAAASIAIVAVARARGPEETESYSRTPADSRTVGKALGINRQRTQLPTAPSGSQAPGAGNAKRDYQAIKPPRSSDFYENSGGKEAEYERVLDQEVAQLYKLSRKYEKSPRRGEYWLQLAERYVEKARLTGFRIQADYDAKAKAFIEKKTRTKPKFDAGLQREYNRKAVELYEWFVRDFPNDRKIDQAFFFLGYNWFELGDSKKGERYYTLLVERYPDSSYVVESYFALGEYHFEANRWQPALDNYARVIAQKQARLNVFAMYKAAWCLYRTARVDAALKMLERVARLSRAGDVAANGEQRRAVNKIRLGSEALKDYVPFYSETGEYQNARAEFQRVSQDEAQALKMLERLAYIYGDAGNRTAAVALFKQLIAANPGGEKAADYQYRIALAYQTADQRAYRQALETWLENFGPQSFWARENAKNVGLVTETAKLQETTARNFVLQLHQTAQNSRAAFSQQQANAGYGLYARHFTEGPRAAEMAFFHAELLFDMEKHEEAARQYSQVVDRDPKGPYAERAIVNAMLALEKDVPTPKQIEERRGKSVEPMPLDPASERFEKAVLRYLAVMPNGDKSSDVERRLGVIYYSYNQFDKAVDMFERILRDHPKSENAEVAGNLILDIYKLKGDMSGLVARGEKFLADPRIAKTKFGQQTAAILEKASYLAAEKAVDKKDYATAAREFERFQASHRNSDLTQSARYRSAVNYEKAGDAAAAIRMHGMVLATSSEDPKTKAIQNDSRNDLARLYSQTAQLEAAAKQYKSYAAANPKDAKAVNAYYNAGLLYDALGERDEATRNYDAYYEKSKKLDRIEVFFLEAELRRKAGEMDKASRLYDRYLKEGGRGEHAVQANYWTAKASERAGRISKTKTAWQSTVEAFKHSKQGVRYAAEARFKLAQEVFNQIASLKFAPSEKQQAQAAAVGESLRKKYLEEMKDVIRYDNAPYIIAALASTGQMFEKLADMYSHVPAPPGYSADDTKKLAELANGRALVFRADAKNSYKAAFNKAVELESYGEWTRAARVGLAKMDPSAPGADAGEFAADSNVADWMGM